MFAGAQFMDQSAWSVERGENETLYVVLILITVQSGTKCVSPFRYTEDTTKRNRIKVAGPKISVFRFRLCFSSRKNCWMESALHC